MVRPALLARIACKGEKMSYETNPTVEAMIAASEAERRARTGQVLVAVTGLELLEQDLSAQTLELPSQQ